MNKFTFDINLREDLLLEASAGTGKTYTLERIVLNLIKDPKYNLSIKDILVVTFTNKATREMKERIRAILNSSYKNEENPVIKEKLSVAVSEFDEAGIFTIHSFCQNTLQTFPFESDIPFNQEIANDTDLLRRAVWDYLRGVEDRGGEAVKGFHVFSRGKSFNDSVETLISLYNRDEYKSCHFIPDSSDVEYLHRIRTDFNSDNGIKKTVGKLSLLTVDDLHNSSKSLKCRTTKKTFEKLKEFLDQTTEINTFDDFIQLFYTPGFINNAWKLTSSYLHSKSKDGLTYNDVSREYRDTILAFDSIFADLDFLFNSKDMERYTKRKNPLDKIVSGSFIVNSLKEIDRIYGGLKEASGVLSYNDLIDKLHSRVMERDTLIKALRSRYKVALIDEFQDTDSKQWDIFSSVFLNRPEHNLVLIGDPKQSIYGFRGADLEIYYKAKELIPVGNRYNLGVNYRSEKGMIQGCNKLFDRIFGIDPEGETNRTEFLPVDSPNPPKERKKISSIKENIEFILYRDKEESTGKKNKIGYFKTIVKKVVTLLNREGNSPGDIAFLVESHRDSGILRDMLIQKGIPAIVSRQRNVFKTREAGDIVLLLKALISPGSSGCVKSLLLSRLFNYPIKEIHNLESSGGLEEFSELLLDWSRIFSHGGLIPLWTKVEEGLKGNGLEKRLLSMVNGERIYTNYKHIIEKLNLIYKSQRLTLSSLLEEFLKEISSASEDEDNFVRLDREIEAVQIMTIHGSKGLEFPIVFFVGGLSSGRNVYSDGVKCFTKEKGWILDFLGKEKSIILNQRDTWEEKKRLYYVAFTRASSKLYLPLFSNGELNPLASLYASINWDENKRAIEDIAGDDLISCSMPVHQQLKVGKNRNKEIKKALAQKIFEDVEGFVSKNSSDFFIDRESQFLPDSDFSPAMKESPLEFKELVNSRGFRDRVTWMSSYSGLTRDSHGSNSKEDADRDDDIEEEFFTTGEINPFNIPGGASFGDLVHEFFEEVSFGKYKLTIKEFLKDEDVNDLYLSLAKKHFDSQWARTYSSGVKELLWNTLNSSLTLGDNEVKLGEFSRDKRIHEMEFYFRIDIRSELDIDGLSLKFEKGFLKGFIDLIFIHNGKLYIGDWKTTTIRGHEKFENYSQDRVEKSMNDHNYHLQGLIYSVALYLYLKKSKPDFNYDKDFGGYYYFYVRGMAPESSTGLSFRKPEESEIVSFLRRIVID